MPIDFRVGDVVRLRRPHPCGSFDWTVVRLGADIGLVCLRCKRRVLLSRSEVERRLRTFLSRAVEPDPLADPEAIGRLTPPGPGAV